MKGAAPVELGIKVEKCEEIYQFGTVLFKERQKCICFGGGRQGNEIQRNSLKNEMGLSG
jgi:hypothetical protein